MEGLNYHHLLYFRVVAREGSIARAAGILRVSQPTISEQIRALEKQIATSLFTRSGRRLVLTEAGRTALRYAEDIHSLGDEMIGILSGNAPSRQESIRVGVSEGLTSPFTSMMISAFTNENTCCLLRTASSEAITADFKAGTLDIALAESTTLGKASQVGSVTVGIYAAPQLARKHKARFPSSLQGAPLLLPDSSSSLGRSVKTWLTSKKIRASVVAESVDSSLLEALARDGRGLAVLAGITPSGLVQIGRIERASLPLHLLASAKYASVAKMVMGKLRRGLR